MWNESLTSPNGQSRVAVGGAEPWTEDTTRVCRNCKVPMWGWPTLQCYEHPIGTSWGAGHHKDKRVHNVLCLISSRSHVRGPLGIDMVTCSLSLVGSLSFDNVTDILLMFIRGRYKRKCTWDSGVQLFILSVFSLGSFGLFPSYIIWEATDSLTQLPQCLLRSGIIMRQGSGLYLFNCTYSRLSWVHWVGVL